MNDIIAFLEVCGTDATTGAFDNRSLEAAALAAGLDKTAAAFVASRDRAGLERLSWGRDGAGMSDDQPVPYIFAASTRPVPFIFAAHTRPVPFIFAAQSAPIPSGTSAVSPDHLAAA